MTATISIYVFAYQNRTVGLTQEQSIFCSFHAFLSLAAAISLYQLADGKYRCFNG